MKKVLIICDLFPPAFGPRMGYLCKYLGEYGWEPTVIAEDVPGNTFAFLAEGCRVVRVRFFTSKNRFLRKLQWALTLILDLLWGYKDKRMYREAEKIAKETKFDAVLCSSFRTFPLPAALKVAQKHHLPLVVDLRDIFEQYTHNEFMSHRLPNIFGLNNLYVSFFKRKSLRERNRVLRVANHVTTVSPWHVKTLKQYNPNVGLIYNGFDPELFYPEEIPSDKFVITYTGRLISTAMRNPELLFKALRTLSGKGVINAETCRVHWYVDAESQGIIASEAEKAGVLPFMDFKGYVKASRIPSVLNHSSVVLLLTNRSEGNGPKGIMTTKFFEALAVGKPILCVRSDEDCLEAALRETNAGVAARTEDEVCRFLEECFTEWKEKGYTTSHTNKETLKSYSRREQAGQFREIFETITTR